jgi:hypothetical protein
MPFIDETKNLGQTETTQTLAPTPYIKEQLTQHSNPQTQTTPQQQKSQHPNLPPRPHTYGIHRLFPMEGDQENKTVTKSSPLLGTAQGTWAQSDIEKANTFAEHLANVFKPHRSKNSLVEEEALIHYL